MQKKIRAVIFDIGGVLVQHKNAVALPEGKFSAGLKIGWRDKKLRKKLKELEMGKISEKELFKQASKTAKKGYSLEEFRAKWCDLFYFREWVPQLMRMLKKCGYKIGIVSNISPWHFEMISEYYRLEELVGVFSLSYKVRARKPDRRIFAVALKGLKEKAENCLYIDDLQKYVDAAKSYGFNAVRYVNYAKLKKDLKRFGILYNSLPQCSAA